LFFGTIGGSLNMFAFWSSCRYLPIGIASCFYASSAIWVAMFSHCILKEKITLFDIIAIFFAIAGVILLNNPF